MLSGHALRMAGSTPTVRQPAFRNSLFRVVRSLVITAWYLPSLFTQSPDSRVEWASQLFPA